MSRAPYNDTDPKILAHLMHAPAERWTPADLAAMLRHQLHAELQPDLEKILPGSSAGITAICRTAAPPITTFHDLFFHPAPPLDLLIFVKEFAKTAPNSTDAPLPAELASILYITSIALAAHHHHQPISSLDKAPITDRLRWAAAQSWIDDATRVLLNSLLAPPSESPP